MTTKAGVMSFIDPRLDTNAEEELIFSPVTICLEGLADVAAFYWLASMVENNP
jgi:hypothetical protein